MLIKNEIFDIAKEAIQIEIAGLKSLIEHSINDNFFELISDIISTKGRVLLSAVGKPGYIARKVAASLSSTGTPAFFIHPTEASHGDLGMITKDDMVILLSNSGNSNELNDIIAYCKRFAIRLVGITRNPNSFLAKSSDLAIILENVKQTNNINSPTTDTIMFMSYLDAVTTVLINVKNFNIDNFKNFHPGGKLGAYMIKVSDIMRTNTSIPKININKNITEAIEEMSFKGVGAVIIVDNGDNILGIISDGDLRRKTLEYGNILNKKIEDIMTNSPKFINNSKLAVEAVALMTEKERYIQVLPVVDDNMKIVGILHIQDLFKARII